MFVVRRAMTLLALTAADFSGAASVAPGADTGTVSGTDHRYTATVSWTAEPARKAVPAC